MSSNAKKHFGFSLLATSFLAAIYINHTPDSACDGNLDPHSVAELRGIPSDMLPQLERYKSLSLKDVCQMPQAKLDRAVFKLSNPKPDSPGRAAHFRAQQMSSEDGKINKQNWLQAQEQVQEMRSLVRNDAGLSSAQWTALGPGNIGGRIRSLVFDPTNSDRMIAGSVSGGLWQTTDAGTTWAPINDFMSNLAVSSLVVDPSDSNVYYAGTGEGVFNIHYITGLGVFKSTDGGNTWNSLSQTASNSDFRWVNRLAMSPNGNTLLAATHGGIWRSTDGGNTWTETLSERTNDIDFHPTDNNKAVAGTWEKIYYTEDGGVTWQEATGAPNDGRTEVEYANSSPDTVYASINKDSGEIWRSTDGGQSYSLRNSGTSYLGGQGWYDNALWVNPTDPTQVIVGGIDLWRSNNSGQSLTKISLWYRSPDSAHADHHYIVEHPSFDGTNNKQVFFTNDGGVYRTDDVDTVINSTGWQELNNELGVTQFYSVAVAPDGTIVGGTQDNGTLVYKGDSENWTESFGGDGGYSGADPTDSNYLYGEYVDLQIHRSTNGGISASYIYDAAMADDNPNFIAPFLLDPNNEQRMFGGAEQLWMTSNVKDPSPNWRSIKPSVSSAISAITVEPGNSNVVYIGHNNGQLYKSTNALAATPSWTRIDTASMPGRNLLRIAVANNNTNVVYASFGGFDPDNLWKSEDGGTTWNDVTGTGLESIPSAPIRGIAIHPTNNQRIYVGTEIGVFSSENGGISWSLQNDGPANVSVDELIWQNDTTLIAATYGRGIFRATLFDDDTPESFAFSAQNEAAMGATATSDTITITGINVAVPVSITDGEYSINCAASGFTTDAGTVRNGSQICVRHSTPDAHMVTTTTQLTVGSANASFSSTTLPDRVPDAFTFNAVTSAETNTSYTSNTITVTGIQVPVSVRVANGEYSIGCAANGFTSTEGTIENNQTICVRSNSSTSFETTQTASLTINSTTETFRITTKVQPPSSGGGGTMGFGILALTLLAALRRVRRS
ncbi:hypothetical protein [Pleionea sp. CnH1-48]|uniref:VPS10 domain-containing protein n=1 Tax=Pleionea sp. CnH1-48 TaxID=2954494 RepID=UPI002096C362|nr:hypothetical protein [Pleionea sp. CnH1-48]MCO7222680.1 hypothetical protein [Pleionea sp. CnH1-48]